MGTFGFSYIGLFCLLLLFLPNLLWAKSRPQGYDELEKEENRFLVLLERAGQVLVTCCALFFSDFNLRAWSPWSLWLLACMVLLCFYEAAWGRYFKTPDLQNFYAPLWGIPCPLALLPVAAFLCLGIYGRVVWMIASALVLGVGHIGIHWAHWRNIRLK